MPLLVTLSLIYASVSNALSLTGAVTDKDADVYYITRMGDRFLKFMSKHQEAANTFGKNEQNRLGTAMLRATSIKDKNALERSVRINEENRLEAQNALSEMRNFVTTLKQSVGAIGSASRCQDLTCGACPLCLGQSPWSAVSLQGWLPRKWLHLQHTDSTWYSPLTGLPNWRSKTAGCRYPIEYVG
jgi:hypothetical protein